VSLYGPDPTQNPLPELEGIPIKDPRWCYWINVLSLIMGFLGNIFLLLNMQNRIRYIVSLPLSILFWLVASSLLIADLVSMHIYATPEAGVEMYSEGFWYGVAAAAIYGLLAIFLMGNFVGWVRGHYPQHFDLTDDQRTLIVQTMLFFVWLAGGGGVYSRLEGWRFCDAVGTTSISLSWEREARIDLRLTAIQLYYCDVTILTIGFGDLYPQENAGRAILIPYSVGGIIMLGLVISSIYRSVKELSEKNIVRHHFEHERERTLGHTVTTSLELERREIELELAHERHLAKQAARGSARSPATANHAAMASLMFHLPTDSRRTSSQGSETRKGSIGTLGSAGGPLLVRSSTLKSFHRQKESIVLLKEEKERFEAMRRIQQSSEMWKNWWRLGMSLTVFATFWLVGAVVFFKVEANTLAMTYWESVYFCWVAILSIGYGDFSPHSGAGRCFFLIWSLIAIPTVTILAGDLTSTVVSVFSHWSNEIAEMTMMPRYGAWRTIMEQHPWLFLHLPQWLQRRGEARAAKERIRAGFQVGDVIDGQDPEKALGNGSAPGDKQELERENRNDAIAAGTINPTLSDMANQHDADVANQGREPDAAALARQLALAIRRAAHDLGGGEKDSKKYSYEQWVEFTRLIRFSAAGGVQQALQDGEDEGLVEWDWIGEDSPMMARVCEPEFVLDRLVESLVRYLRRNPPVDKFALTLRERGEDALRMRTAAHHAPAEEPDKDADSDELVIKPLKRTMSAPVMAKSATASLIGRMDFSKQRRSSLTADAITPAAPTLHPVEEEDHEHHDPRP